MLVDAPAATCRARSAVGVDGVLHRTWRRGGRLGRCSASPPAGGRPGRARGRVIRGSVRPSRAACTPMHEELRDRPAQPAGRLLPVHGDADHRHARGRRRGLQPPDGRLRLRPAGRADQPADRPRPALPAEGPVGARAPGQPGLGRRRGLRRHLPRAAQRPAQARAPTPSCASWSAGCRAASSTATGRCGRSTSSRASRAAGSRSSPRPTTRWSTASRRSTSAP